MEVRRLRYFAAVPSELHFARAAERLNIASPTLSQQIKWLESHLGGAPFTGSTKRKVELTFAGQQFQKRALALIGSFEQAERFAREAERGEVGDVRLGYMLSPRVVPVFSDRHAPTVTPRSHSVTDVSAIIGAALHGAVPRLHKIVP